MGLIDTSVVIALGEVDPGLLPPDSAVSALTLAELAGGPVVAEDQAERARRQERLQTVEATFESLPFDARALVPMATFTRQWSRLVVSQGARASSTS